ncbi:hypothetical protein ABB37_05752 [Leptomonas pyrrhocoris]|uniref:SPRY domain-containing protein n=1 Tax=Leptomonas pyrrhocoris TaxID=157538 RepID=A0A0M9FZV7_LEPPY|nr:hypothetical protein ABB37_05752 [Leptomonas pyrrhocoris]KPA79286.1 hypothetical protein ABB37_05752 [Leptomonas pyrrhocoris]|eukprot:XP_015657725.1 hypothetical protein ABB37_05752 [Leptomonas pyrrhocoris]
MFYTGWEFLAPTSMNVRALAAEMRHTHSSSPAGDSFVSQQLLSAITASPTLAPPLHSTTDTAPPSSATAAAATADAPAASADLETTLKPSEVPKSKSPMNATPKARHPHRPRSSDGRSGRNNVGCVLHLAPRPALSYKEMEQQLQRRTTGASDCFHVKSNLPILAQNGVLLMECVVGRPTESGNSSTAAKGDSKQATLTAEAKTKPASPTPSSKHPLPALVVGVCPRQLPWFNLPGEANNSIGFYVTQRHIVKHGGEDTDEVIVPCDIGNSGSGSGGGGGGRIGEGDVVGCLVDLIQHTLSFTVNTQIVSTHSMDPAADDGSLYFAIGLARRPQLATDITVRFYTGSACLSDAAPRIHAASPGAPPPHQPCFPLAQYVRALAIASVRQRGLDAADGENHAGGAAAAAGSNSTSRVEVGAGDFMSAIAEKESQPASAAAVDGASLSPLAGRSADATATAVPSPDAIRDLRFSAVLRDYLCARGMARTLKALDTELNCLIPSHARLYTQTSSEDRDDDGAAAAHKAITTSCTPHTKATVEQNKSRRRDELLSQRTPHAGETRAAWQAYADSMADLRRTLLTPPGATANPTKPASCLPDLLLEHVLWRPSLIAASVRFIHEGTEAAPAALTEQKRSSPPHASLLKTTAAAPHVGGGHRSKLKSKSNNEHRPADAQRLPPSTPSSAAPALSPYAWFRHCVPPALLTLCFLTLRQDIRYLLHAHYAVEEMWRLLRECLRKAKDTCKAAENEGAARDGPPPLAAFTFAPTMDAEHNAVAAFSHFFTHLMWDVGHALPSAVARVTRAPQSEGTAALETAASPLQLHAKAVEGLAGLAGHGSDALPQLLRRHGKALEDGRDMRGLRSEAHQFRTLAAAHTASLRATPERRISSGKHGGLARALSSSASTAASSQVEDAVLFLYSSAVVPAAAPSRSAQVRLLQTLCSLFTHTLSTLRQLQELCRDEDANGASSVVPNNELHSMDKNKSRRTGVQAVLASVDLLEALLDTVQQRLGQLVWRRLVHALEEVNCQLEERLSWWQTATAEGAVSAQDKDKAGDAKPISLKDGSGSVKSPRRHEPINEWTTDYAVDDGTAGSEDEEEEREAAVDVAEDKHTSTSAVGEGDGATLERAQSESPSVSFSSFQAAPTTDDDQVRLDEDHERNEEGNSKSKNGVTPRARHASYEALTESLPPLRLLWRRVAARAALEPSRHLVTTLFVQELRASLLLAPHANWRESTTSERAATATTATDVACGGATVSVKRPLNVDAAEDVEDGVDAGHSISSAGGVRDAAAVAAETQWFTEELYLSSVYMKRVLKHLSGR